MNQEKEPAMPVWVKVLGIVVVLLIVAVLGAHLMGLGGAKLHSMHMPSTESTEQASDGANSHSMHTTEATE